MKITELISALEDLKEKYGDGSVFIQDPEYGRPFGFHARDVTWCETIRDPHTGQNDTRCVGVLIA